MTDRSIRSYNTNIVEISKERLINDKDIRKVVEERLFNKIYRPKKGSKEAKKIDIEMKVDTFCKSNVNGEYIYDKLFNAKAFTHIYLLLDRKSGGKRKKSTTKKSTRKNSTRKKGTRKRRIYRKRQKGGNLTNDEILRLLQEFGIRGFMITSETNREIHIEIICSAQKHMMTLRSMRLETYKRISGSAMLNYIKNKAKRNRIEKVTLDAIYNVVKYYLGNDFMLIPQEYSERNVDEYFSENNHEDILFEQLNSLVMIEDTDELIDNLTGNYECAIDTEDIDDIEKQKEVCVDDGYSMIWYNPDM